MCSNWKCQKYLLAKFGTTKQPCIEARQGNSRTRSGMLQMIEELPWAVDRPRIGRQALDEAIAAKAVPRDTHLHVCPEPGLPIDRRIPDKDGGAGGGARGRYQMLETRRIRLADERTVSGNDPFRPEISRQIEAVQDPARGLEWLIRQHGQPSTGAELGENVRDTRIRLRVIEEALVIDRRNRSNASAGFSAPAAAKARHRTGAPSPTIRPIASSESGPTPYATSVSFAESAMSRRESTSVPSRSKTTRWVDECRNSVSRHVLGERRWSLPHLHPDHRQAVGARVLENEPRDSLNGWVAIEQEHRLPSC